MSGLSPSLLLESFPLACLVPGCWCTDPLEHGRPSLCIPSTFTFTHHSTRFISVCLSVRLSIIDISVDLSIIHPFIRPSGWLSVCLPVYQSSICLSVWLCGKCIFVCPSVQKSLCVHAGMYACIYVCLFTGMKCMYVFMYVCMKMHACIDVHMNVFSMCLVVVNVCMYVSRYIILYGIIILLSVSLIHSLCSTVEYWERLKQKVSC